jgi:membrane fusion protein (multidrug efflux system)
LLDAELIFLQFNEEKMKAITLNLLCVFFLMFSSCAKKEPSQGPAPDIPVFQTKSQQVPIHREYVGQIFGFKDIDIRARVEGYLEDIHFEEGSRIEKGVLLYTLESQPFEENVAAKMSGVAAAKSNLAQAQSYLNRIRPLAEQNAVSKSDLDSAVAQYETFIEVVKAAEANLRAAKIQFGYTQDTSKSWRLCWSAA